MIGLVLYDITNDIFLSIKKGEKTEAVLCTVSSTTE